MSALDEDRELRIYHAFLALSPSRYPIAPFYLNPWTRINDPKWFDILRKEVEAAVDYLEGRRDRPPPRQHTGALLAQLRHLQTLILENHEHDRPLPPRLPHPHRSTLSV